MKSTRTAKILIVDDEPHITMAVDFLMKDQGHITQVAHNGQEALKMIPTFQPELIILDVMMPLKNGFEVAKEVRRDPKMHNCKIIFLTAKGTDRDKGEGYTSGADVYLTKPFDNQALINLVNEIITYG